MMTPREYILDELQREYSFKEGSNVDEIDFLEEGYMDSIGLLQFIVQLEDEFNIHFTDDELASKEFKTVGRLIAMVEKKMETENG